MPNIEEKPTKSSRSREEWESHIKRWKDSGLTQAEYCRMNGIKQYHLSYWKKRIADTAPGGEQALVEIPPPASLKNSSPLIELCIDSGFKISLRLNLNLNRTWSIL